MEARAEKTVVPAVMPVTVRHPLEPFVLDSSSKMMSAVRKHADAARTYYDFIVNNIAHSRERSLALTQLEQAAGWAEKAIVASEEQKSNSEDRATAL